MNEMNEMKGTEKYTKIEAIDIKKFNAHHKYRILTTDTAKRELALISFQKGPIKENGVNGIHDGDLIAIVIHRLESFQGSKYACNENSDAIDALELALQTLRSRTNKREERGIEGTSEI